MLILPSTGRSRAYVTYFVDENLGVQKPSLDIGLAVVNVERNAH